MRKPCVTLFVLSLLFLPSSMIEAGTGPKLVVEEGVFNFGELWEGEIIEQPFKVRNTGDQPLEIQRIKPG